FYLGELKSTDKKKNERRNPESFSRPEQECNQECLFSVVRFPFDLVCALFYLVRSLICALLDAFAGFLRGFFGGMTGFFHVLLRRVIVLVILRHRSGCERDRPEGCHQKDRDLFFHFSPRTFCWSTICALRFPVECLNSIYLRVAARVALSAVLCCY